MDPSAGITPPPVLPAASTASAAALGGAVAGLRRSDGGVSLGLFSKIAAARKEKLALARDDSHGSMRGLLGVTDGISSSSPTAFEKRTPSPLAAVTAAPLGSLLPAADHFPEIHDLSGAHASRTAVSRAPLNPRKVTTRNFAQNLRWAKRGSTDVTDARSSSLSISPMVRNVQPERLLQPPQQRRSVFELQAMEHRQLPPRDSSFSAVRGYVRYIPIEKPCSVALEKKGTNRSPEAFSNSLEMATEVLHRRSLLERGGSSSNIQKPKTADPAIRPNGSLLKVSASPELVGGLDHPQVNPRSPPIDPNTDLSEQELYFAETTEIPGVPIVYRNQKSKASNPERLNLDRRNLPVIPLLEGEQMLRLLNLQNNLIKKVENLLGLPNLIFLDLYNNRVEKLENFSVVPNLRVLMLGKNCLKTIENLECLKKLDVLDLHSNDIEVMQNLNELRELRVLNLGGNRISTLENIEKLTLLTELNLRRNQIDKIGALGKLPSLQRIFLSNNKIEAFEALDPLLSVTSISELRLDGNIVCESNQSEYRAKMIHAFPMLKHLDLKPLNDMERKEALAFYSQAKSNASKERDELEEAQRAHAIQCAKTLWERREKLTSSANATRSVKDLSLTTSWGSGNSSNRKVATGPSSSSSNLGAAGNHEECENAVKPTSREDSTVHNNKTGFSEVEVRGDFRVLVIYGDALEALGSAKMHSLVNAITFRYIHIDKVVATATASVSSNLKLFGRLRRLNFAHNDLQSFEQLLWLGSLGTKAEELFISSNPVCSKALLKRFIGARISNTLRLNGEEISASDRYLGKQLFPKAAGCQKALGFTTPETPAASSSSSQQMPLTLKKAANKEKNALVKPTMRIGACSTACLVVGDIFSTANDIERKAAVLEDAWRGLLMSIVRETLQDIERRDSFMSGCLEGL